eukprot:3560948-Rhodomonas_salina.1
MILRVFHYKKAHAPTCISVQKGLFSYTYLSANTPTPPRVFQYPFYCQHAQTATRIIPVLVPTCLRSQYQYRLAVPPTSTHIPIRLPVLTHAVRCYQLAFHLSPSLWPPYRVSLSPYALAMRCPVLTYHGPMRLICGARYLHATTPYRPTRLLGHARY